MRQVPAHKGPQKLLSNEKKIEKRNEIMDSSYGKRVDSVSYLQLREQSLSLMFLEPSVFISSRVVFPIPETFFGNVIAY